MKDYPEDLAVFTGNFRKGLAGEDVHGNYEFRVLTALGETIYVDYNARLIESDGRIVGTRCAHKIGEVMPRLSAPHPICLYIPPQRSISSLIYHDEVG